jgi:dipeptidyl aminopeptidase/acylaminoacyl peptidase
MVKALEEKQIMHAYVPFEGEQHGFRKSENIERALEAELYFYGKVLGFSPADEIEPVDIKNLPAS